MLTSVLTSLVRVAAAAARLKPTVVDGQTLDPHIRVLCKAGDWIGKPLEALDPALARTEITRRQRLTIGRPLAVPSEDLVLAGRPARLYRPTPEASDLLLYFHGGGFCLGDLDSHHVACQRLARASGMAVLAVDYRLAPEHPFPAAVDDALAAWEAAQDLGFDRIAVGGDSAGGTLAAVIALEARDRGGPAPAAQLLLYPSLDRASVTASREHFDRGFLLTGALTDWFMDHYLQGHPSSDPLVSPSRWPTGHAELPPTLMVIAGFDILRDEARAHASTLRARGVTVVVQEHEGLVHGFLQLDGAAPLARRATDQAGEALRELLVAVGR